MDDPALQEIMRALGRLEGEVSEGFSGIHTRQDITNGRIAKSEERINSLETSRATSDGWKQRSLLSSNIIWGLLTSAISGIILYILIKYAI